MTHTPSRTTGRPDQRVELPAWLYPTDHQGRCYDQIGALSVGVGAGTSPVLAAASTVLQHLLAGHWHLGLADVVPDPATVAGAFALTPLFAAGLFLYRHWRQHRAVALLEDGNEALRAELAALEEGNAELLAELVAAGAAGELDMEQLLADLAAAAGEATVAAGAQHELLIQVDAHDAEMDEDPAREEVLAA